MTTTVASPIVTAHDICRTHIAYRNHAMAAFDSPKLDVETAQNLFRAIVDWMASDSIAAAIAPSMLGKVRVGDSHASAAANLWRGVLLYAPGLPDRKTWINGLGYHRLTGDELATIAQFVDGLIKTYLPSVSLGA